ncbi:flagellar protein FliT [Luminiphilus sp.]|nr:flagellar protein FliT [Luminiphilus sp.]MDB2511078.1 flagellar protein FliT [Luminiphilus sp.]
MGSAVTQRCLEALLARRGQCALLANVLTRTSRMLEAARSDDWPLVTAMENKRSQLVKQCFSEPVGAENSELFSEALAIMLHMNEELVALLEAAKEDASVRRTDHQFAHEAIGHYLDTKSESL